MCGADTCLWRGRIEASPDSWWTMGSLGSCVCNVITLIHRIMCVVCFHRWSVVRCNGRVDGKPLLLSVTVRLSLNKSRSIYRANQVTISSYYFVIYSSAIHTSTQLHIYYVYFVSGTRGLLDFVYPAHPIATQLLTTSTVQQYTSQKDLRCWQWSIFLHR